MKVLGIIFILLDQVLLILLLDILQDLIIFRVSFAENLLTMAESGLRSKNFYTGLSHLNEFRGYMNGGGYFNNGYDTLTRKYDPYIQGDFEPSGIENSDNITKEDALLREILKKDI